MDILCEVNIGGEESKSGIAPNGLKELMDGLSELEGVRIRGLMTIPPPSDSDVFLGRMKELYDKVSSEYQGMDTLSMGMTHDYADAIRYGSTLCVSEQVCSAQEITQSNSQRNAEYQHGILRIDPVKKYKNTNNAEKEY